jgi:flagellar hook-associated protein 3 FlgL
MRVSAQTRATMLVRAIDQQTSAMNMLNQELATGHRVNQPSDDPVAAGAIMRTNSYIAGLNANLSVVNYAESFSQSAGAAMGNSTSILSQAQMAAIQAANGTASATDLQALGSQVNQYLESLVQDANSQFDGRYLFSGTKTDTAAITVTRDAQGNIQNVAYQGSDTDLTFPVGQGRSATASVTAQAAYMNVLAAMKSLRDDLNNTQGLSSQDQQAALSNDLSAISDAQSSFLAQTAEVGSQQSQLTSLSDQIQTSLTQAQSILSECQDADVAEVSVNLQTALTLYEAIVSSGASQLKQANLFSYL